MESKNVVSFRLARARRRGQRGSRYATRKTSQRRWRRADAMSQERSTESGFFALALSGPVVRRALCFGVVIGTILISINHGDAILRGEITSTRLWKMALTVCVPYCVSTISSVQAMRTFAREAVERTLANEKEK